MAEWLACSPVTRATRVRSKVGSLICLMIKRTYFIFCISDSSSFIISSKTSDGKSSHISSCSFSFLLFQHPTFHLDLLFFASATNIPSWSWSPNIPSNSTLWEMNEEILAEAADIALDSIGNVERVWLREE